MRSLATVRGGRKVRAPVDSVAGNARPSMKVEADIRHNAWRTRHGLWRESHRDESRQRFTGGSETGQSLRGVRRIGDEPAIIHGGQVLVRRVINPGS